MMRMVRWARRVEAKLKDLAQYKALSAQLPASPLACIMHHVPIQVTNDRYVLLNSSHHAERTACSRKDTSQSPADRKAVFAFRKAASCSPVAVSIVPAVFRVAELWPLPITKARTG